MSKIDSTINATARNRFYTFYHDIISEVVKTMEFTHVEAESILMVYYKFVLSSGSKDKNMTTSQFFCFLRMLKITDGDLMSRILDVLAPEMKTKVPAMAWVKLISIFMSTDLDVRAQFVFQVYDKYNYGFLTRDHIAGGVNNFFHGDDEDYIEDLRAEMIETLFQKFDVDKDGLISYTDYSSVVFKQPLLLEFLGKCLPETGELSLMSYCMNLLTLLDSPRRGQGVALVS